MENIAEVVWRGPWWQNRGELLEYSEITGACARANREPPSIYNHRLTASEHMHRVGYHGQCHQWL